MNSVKEHLGSLFKDKHRAEREHQRLTELADQYPDLEIYTTRWNQTKYMSEAVNTTAGDYSLHHSCGCCSDSPLLFGAYTKHPNGAVIYANPAEICIGERDWNMSKGDRLDYDWKELLQKHNINPLLIERLEVKFEDNELIEHEDEDHE